MTANRSTALEHVRPGANAPARVMDFDAMREQAAFIAGTELVPTALQGKPDAIVVVGLLGQELGVPFMAAVSEIHVIEGKASPSAQLRLALVRRAGHEANFVETSSEKAVIRGRRREHRNDPNGWVVVEWTIKDAERAGLLDEFAEEWKKDGQGPGAKWKIESKLAITRDASGKYVVRDTGDPLPDWARKQVASGRIKSKANWHRYPAEMLRARAASALCRMHFSDVLAGLGSTDYTAEELGIDIDQDLDDRLEAPTAAEPPDDDEIVVDPDAAIPTTSTTTPPASGSGPVAGPVEMADEFDMISLTKRWQEFDPEFRAVAWERWRAALLPPPPAYEGMTKDQADAANVLVFKVLEDADAIYGRRQRKAFALLGKIGVKAEAERHALIGQITDGRTESTTKLTEPEVDALEAYVKVKLAETEAASAPAAASPAAGAPVYADDPFAGLPEPPEPDDDDPGRPF